MRIAIAGTNKVAYWIAYYLSTETYHQFIFLSRAPKPHLQAHDWQVFVVDYANHTSLTFSLEGVDLVISTITGPSQLALIDAAKEADVRRFAPAEFGGSVLHRPPIDPLDRGHSAAIARLQFLQLPYTVLSCGILYERFGPGGTALANIGHSSGGNGEGEFLMNVRTMKARIPHDIFGQAATICLTSAEDVGKFVVAALEIPEWPTELRMCGERISVSELVQVAEDMRGHEFERFDHNLDTLSSALTWANLELDVLEKLRIHMLIATGEGRFDFSNANLNNMVVVQTQSFQLWLFNAWAGQL